MDIMGIFQIICLIFVNITDIRCKTTIVCNAIRGNLTCSDNKLIHVESISFWLNSGHDCNDETRTACGQNLTNGDTGLTPRCNGQTSCIETVDYTTNKQTNCKKKKKISTLFTYRCIDRDSAVIDMCDSIEHDGENIFLLTSPGYPGLSNNTQGECRCNIRGTNITAITILDLRLVSATDGTRSGLYIQYGDNTENITSRNTSRTLYNYKLQLPLATTANISFTSNQINGLKLWMEIKGMAMYVSCNNNTSDSTQSTSMLTSSTISSNISITSISSSTEKSNTSLMSNSTTVQTASIISSSTISSSMSTTRDSTSSSTEESNTSSMVTNSTTVQTASTISPSTNSSPAPTTSPSVSTRSPVPPLPASESSELITFAVVSGTIVLVLIIIVVVIILCCRIHRKRTETPPLNVDVHVNVSSNNYFVLEVPKDRDSVPFDANVDLDYQESNLNNIKSDSSTNQRYSVVETGHTNNQDYSKVYKSDQKHKPVAHSKPVEDVEILQNDLYIPFQPPLLSKPTPSESCESKEPVESETRTDPLRCGDSTGRVGVPTKRLVVKENASRDINDPVLEKHTPPSNPENITDSNQPSDIEMNQPSDIEIMENDLYVSYDNYKANQPSDIKANQPSDIKVNQPDVEIMENDLYVSYDKSTANQPSDIKANQPSDIKANQPSDMKVNQPSDIEMNQPSDIEIMENDLYVSYDNSTVNQPSDIKANQPSDTEANRPLDI